MLNNLSKIFKGIGFFIFIFFAFSVSISFPFYLISFYPRSFLLLLSVILLMVVGEKDKLPLLYIRFLSSNRLKHSNEIIKSKKRPKWCIFLKYIFNISIIGYIRILLLLFVYRSILNHFKVNISNSSVWNLLFIGVLIFFEILSQLKYKSYNTKELKNYKNYFNFISLFVSVLTIVSLLFYILNFTYFEKSEMVYRDMENKLNVVYIDGNYYKKNTDLDIFSKKGEEQYTVYKKENIIIVPEKNNEEYKNNLPDEIFSNSPEKAKGLYYENFVSFEELKEWARVLLIAFLINTVIVVIINLNSLEYHKRR